MRPPSESLGSCGVSSGVSPVEGIRNRREGGLKAQSRGYAYPRDEDGWTKKGKGYLTVSVLTTSGISRTPHSKGIHPRGQPGTEKEG